MLRFSRFTAVGLLGSSGDTVLAVTNSAFMVVSRHQDLG